MLVQSAGHKLSSFPTWHLVSARLLEVASAKNDLTHIEGLNVLWIIQNDHGPLDVLLGEVPTNIG